MSEKLVTITEERLRELLVYETTAGGHDSWNSELEKEEWLNVAVGMESIAAESIIISKSQRSMMINALGLDYPNKCVDGTFQNHYHTEHGSSDYLDWEQLVDQGLAVSILEEFPGHIHYEVTQKGRNAIGAPDARKNPFGDSFGFMDGSGEK